jgi:hypothetical protein
LNRNNASSVFSKKTMSFAALQTQGLFAETAKLIQNPHGK